MQRISIVFQICFYVSSFLCPFIFICEEDIAAYRDFNLMNWISNIRKHWQLHTKKRDGNQNRYGMTPNWHSYFLSLKSSNRNEYQLPTWTMTNSPICFLFLIFLHLFLSPLFFVDATTSHAVCSCMFSCHAYVLGSTTTIWW